MLASHIYLADKTRTGEHRPLGQPEYGILLVRENHRGKGTHVRNPEAAQTAQMQQRGNGPDNYPEQPEGVSQNDKRKAQDSNGVGQAIRGKNKAGDGCR